MNGRRPAGDGTTGSPVHRRSGDGTTGWVRRTAGEATSPSVPAAPSLQPPEQQRRKSSGRPPTSPPVRFASVRFGASHPSGASAAGAQPMAPSPPLGHRRAGCWCTQEPAHHATRRWLLVHTGTGATQRDGHTTVPWLRRTACAPRAEERKEPPPCLCATRTSTAGGR